jgi:predicted ferric reductase
LPQRLKPGQSGRVEGPYGRFDLGRRQRRARQIWIAGGIGVTPFLAWLESLQATPDKAPAAELHYCTRDQASDAFAARLLALCAALPSVKLRIHDARQGAKLTAAALGVLKNAEIWYCGPAGLAEALRQGMAALGWRPRFHQEAFEMR